MIRPTTILVALVLLGVTALAVGAHPQAAVDLPPPPESIVTLVTGEVLRGVIVDESTGEVVLSHALLGRLVVPRAAIRAIDPAPSEATAVTTGATEPAGEAQPVPPPGPAAAEAAMAPEAEAPPPEPAPAKPMGLPDRPAWAASRIDLLELEGDLPAPGTVDWRANVQASLSGVNSDNDQLDLRVAAAFARLTHTDKFSGSAEYFYSVLNNETTDNNLLATSVYDYYILPTNWLAFGKLQYQYDSFQDWENRISAYAGLGYRLFRERPFAMTLKGGFGATHEFGNVNETTPEAYGEVAFAWWIDDRQSIEGSVNIAPDLTDLNQYRILARLDWIFRLDTRGLSLVGGLREEYQAQVGEGSTNNDFRYYLGIRMDF